MILMHDWLPMVQNAAGLRAYKKHESDWKCAFERKKQT